MREDLMNAIREAYVIARRKHEAAERALHEANAAQTAAYEAKKNAESERYHLAQLLHAWGGIAEIDRIEATMADPDVPV